MNLKPLWRCPKCGERFVTANCWHSCGKHTVTALFSRSEPQVRKLFKEFTRMVRLCGPVKLIPQKTRAAFQVRMRFASCYPRKSHLLCGLALPRALDNPRFTKIEVFSPHLVYHYFRVQKQEDLDREVQSWLCESYGVGAQERFKQ